MVLSTSPNDAEALQIMSNADTEQERWRERLAEMEQAYELDPGNYEIEWQLGQIYQAMRRYKDRERLLADSRTASRVTLYWRYIASVALKLDEGDPAGAREILKQIPPDYSPISGIWQERFATALFLRDYDEAERVIAATPAKWQAEMYGGNPPRSWQTACSHICAAMSKRPARFLRRCVKGSAPLRTIILIRTLRPFVMPSSVARTTPSAKRKMNARSIRWQICARIQGQ